jgi:hypothetical protein
VLADRVGHKYYDYWTKQGILAAKSILRMLEVNLVADLLIAMIEGIKSKKQIKKFYDLYETNFEHDSAELETRFDSTVAKIAELYPEGLSGTEFRRVHLFYSLFTAVVHCLYGVPKLQDQNNQLVGAALESARNRLDRIDEIYEAQDLASLSKPEQQFLVDSRRATTDETVRERRTLFLLGLIG